MNTFLVGELCIFTVFLGGLNSSELLVVGLLSSTLLSFLLIIFMMIGGILCSLLECVRVILCLCLIELDVVGLAVFEILIPVFGIFIVPVFSVLPVLSVLPDADTVTAVSWSVEVRHDPRVDGGELEKKKKNDDGGIGRWAFYYSHKH
jgi:hypothetical protein